MQNGELISGFESYLKNNRSAALNTLASYVRDVVKFTEYYTAHHDGPVEQATKDEIEKYVQWLKNQGRMGSCWTFGMLSAVESALLKAYGLEFDLSEGNLHHNMLRYFIYGDTLLNEGGFS